MTWTWTFENAAGEVIGRSEVFESRSDAESWIGAAYPDLLDDGIDQVRLFDAGTEIFGPMSLHEA